MSRASKLERRQRRVVPVAAARRRRYAPAYALGDDARLVERPAPGMAPTAFRIWQAGENAADGGADVFSQRSAELLIEQQRARGNLFSIDINHRSLSDDGPAEGTRAAGWHQLEVRPDESGKPELWAVGVEWSPDIKAGLEEKPPRWRYFSPAFDVDPTTNEVIRYVNTAVCINPATWNNPQLAAISNEEIKRSTMPMTKAQREALAVLNAMSARMNGEGSAETKAAAVAMYTAEGGEEMHKQLRALAEGEDSGDDNDKPPPTSKSPGSEPPKTKTETAPAPAVANTARARAVESDPEMLAVMKRMAAKQEELDREVTRLRSERRAEDVERILASRKDLSAATVAQMRSLGSPSRVRAIVDSLPLPAVKPPAPAAGAGTRGDSEGAAGVRDPKIDEVVLRAMKLPLQPRAEVPAHVGFTPPTNGNRVFRTMQPRFGVGFNTGAQPGKGG